MANTIGLVEAVDTNGVYVSTPDVRGVVRGPFQALSPVKAGDRVLIINAEGSAVVAGSVEQPAPIDVRWFGARGDGTSDDTEAIQAAIDAAHTDLGGTVLIPSSGVFIVTETLRVPPGVVLRGSSRRSSPDGAVLKAGAGFTGVAVVASRTWFDDADLSYWHGGEVSGLRVDANNLARYAIAVYCGGEASVIRNVLVRNATEAGIYFAGEHASATLENVTSDGADYGFVFGPHPDDNTLSGNGGVVRMWACSGDNSDVAHVRISGSHRTYIVGLKSEGHPTGVLFDGDGFTGGGAAQLHLSGGFNGGDVGTDLVRIEGTGSHPIVTLTEVAATGYTSLINDTVQSKLIDAGGPLLYKPGTIQYGGSNLHATGQVILWNGTQLQASNVTTDGSSPTTVSSIVYVGSDDVTHLRAALSGGLKVRGVNGATGVHVDDSDASTPQLGFFGTTATGKPTVTGSRGGNAALQSLLTALANLGLITDSSS